MHVRTLLGLVAAGALGTPAFAGVNASFEWVEVDNTVGNPSGDPLNGAAWAATNWVTYDLFITGDFILNGVNLGSVPGEDHLGLNFDTDVFNTQGFVASNFETNAQGSFAASLYDTYVTLGDNNPGGAAADELIGIALNGLEPVDGRIRGAWAHNPVNGGTPQDASTGIRILRISFDGDSLGNPGGGPFIGTGAMEIGTPDGVFTVTLFPPAPGAAGVLALGGVFAARRRR